MMPYTFRYFSQKLLDDELELYWKKIQQKKTRLQYYHTFEWHQAVCRYLLPSEELFHIVAFMDEQPVAIFPLQATSHTLIGGLTVPILQLPCHDHIPLTDCICIEQDLPNLLAALMRFVNQHLKKKWVMLKLEDVREDADLSKLLNTEKHLSLIPGSNNHSAYLQINETFESTTEHMSNKFVKNVRRLQNKANREGELNYRSISPADNNEHAFQAFIDVESDGWKGASKTAIKCNPELVEFYRAISEVNSPDVQSVINLISINGTPIAAQLGLKIKDKLNLLKIGFSEQYKSIGPGNLVLVETINHAIKNQQKIISFVTSPAWAENWRSATQSVSSYYLFNNTLYATLLYYLLKFKRKLSSEG